mgnify:CR=1 FL=1
MTTLRISDGDVTSARAQVVVVGVTKDDALKIVSGSLPTAVRRTIARDLERIGCDKVARIHFNGVLDCRDAAGPRACGPLVQPTSRAKTALTQ